MLGRCEIDPDSTTDYSDRDNCIHSEGGMVFKWNAVNLAKYKKENEKVILNLRQ